MSETAQAGFQSSNDQWCVFVGAADEIAVYHGCVIRPPAHDSARRKRIFLTAFFRYGIMIDHGIHISTGYNKTDFWLSQDTDTVRIFPVRL